MNLFHFNPAVLADHGLAAALQRLSGRAGLPIELDTTLIHRTSAASEGCAYFTVSEAAVAKHIESIFAKLDLTPDDGHHRVKGVLPYFNT